jgi:hypothetical protein
MPFAGQQPYCQSPRGAVHLPGRHRAAAVAHQEPLRALVGRTAGGGGSICGSCGGKPGVSCSSCHHTPQPSALTQRVRERRSWDMWQMRRVGTAYRVRCVSANATSSYRHFLGSSSDPAQFSNKYWFEADPNDDTRVYGWSHQHDANGCSALNGYICEIPASVFACFPPPVPPPKPPSPPSPPAPPAPPSCEPPGLASLVLEGSSMFCLIDHSCTVCACAVHAFCCCQGIT